MKKVLKFGAAKAARVQLFDVPVGPVFVSARTGERGEDAVLVQIGEVVEVAEISDLPKVNRVSITSESLVIIVRALLTTGQRETANMMLERYSSGLGRAKIEAIVNEITAGAEVRPNGIGRADDAYTATRHAFRPGSEPIAHASQGLWRDPAQVPYQTAQD